MAALPAPADVAALLLGRDTRDATLDALEAAVGRVDHALALAAMPALADVQALDVVEAGAATHRRVALLQAQLVTEAPTHEALAVFGASIGSVERYAKVFCATGNALAVSLAKPVAAFAQEDALTAACSPASWAPALLLGFNQAIQAAGMSPPEFSKALMTQEPLWSKRRMPTDEVPRKLARLLLELLRGDEPPTVAAGAWHQIKGSIFGRPAVARSVVELGIFDLMSATLRALGPPEVWVSVSRQRSGTALAVLLNVTEVFKGFAGEAARPDLAAFVQSGLFDDTLAAIAAVERMGTVEDVSLDTFELVLAQPKYALDQPGCEDKIRSLAHALRFCLDHPLVDPIDHNRSTGRAAATLCAAVFGRDEGGSDFAFTQKHIDEMIHYWSAIIAAEGMYANSPPTKSNVRLLELVISDVNKTLLLKAPGLLEYLRAGLLLDPDHPRQSLKDEQKIWLTTMHAESFAQLATFPEARVALLEDATVVPALEEVRDKGLSEEAREFAGAALLALSDKQLQEAEGQKHVMLSCE